MQATETYLCRESSTTLGDVDDTWELVKIISEAGEEDSEDILAVFQTTYQVQMYCRAMNIRCDIPGRGEDEAIGSTYAMFAKIS